MLGHYLVTLYRSLTRHRLYAVLNVFGLAVGIAVFLVLWLDVRFETSWERWIPNASQIYGVSTQFIGPQSDGRRPAPATMGGLLDELRADFPQVVGTRVRGGAATLLQDGHVMAEGIASVDPNFFQVFDLPLLAGDRTSALAAPDDLVVTTKAAKQYFGTTDPIGRRIALTYGGRVHVHRVTGVIAEPPKNTDQYFELIVPLNVAAEARDPRWTIWGMNQLSTYLRFATPEAAHALDANLDTFTDRHGVRDIGATPPPHEMLRLRTYALPSFHLSNPRDAAVVAGLGAVGLLTLLLAAVNYVNLATARSGLRAREVAVRKVLGATGPALLAQFMSEAALTALLGALIGLALCELALPFVNTAGGLSLRITYFGADGVLWVLLLTVLVVGGGAGLYPALVLSRFRPAAVLASVRNPGGGRTGGRVREGLVVVQFAIAIAFAIATGVILTQTRFVRQADLGFRRHGLIVVESIDSSQLTDPQRHSLLEAWRSLPGVEGATMGDIAPGNDDSTWTTNTKRPGQPGLGPSISYVQSAEDFLHTYGARVLAGRLPDRAHGGDVGSTAAGFVSNKVGPIQGVVLNLAATRALGFESPQAAIGQRLLDNLSPGVFQPWSVIGVVADIRFRSPRAPVPPTIYLAFHEGFGVMAAGVRYTGDPRAVIDRLRGAWRRIAPDVPFRARTSEDSLDRYYRPDDQHGRLFTLGALLAVLIGCVGLYGLTSFSTAQRTREIGIRKTLGASTADVLRLLVGQLLRPVLLANLLAWPLAYFAMRGWLNGFDQRIGLNPLYFLGASALMLAVALATVVGQALMVARAEPAKALRHE